MNFRIFISLLINLHVKICKLIDEIGHTSKMKSGIRQLSFDIFLCLFITKYLNKLGNPSGKKLRTFSVRPETRRSLCQSYSTRHWNSVSVIRQEKRFFFNSKLVLERWLSSWQDLPLLQRTWFPSPTQWLTVISNLVSGYSTLSSGL